VNYGDGTNYQGDPLPAGSTPSPLPATWRFAGAPFGFSPYTVRLQNIIDGTSTTLMASETVQGIGSDLRGFTWWARGAPFATVLPTNSSSPDIVTQNCNSVPERNLPCVNNGGAWNIQAARSRHPGGVQAVMCDGSVRFFPNAIAINTWRALSTTGG